MTIVLLFVELHIYPFIKKKRSKRYNDLAKP